MLVFRMKKKHGIKKALDEVPLSELETWKTRKLLVRLKRLLAHTAIACGYNRDFIICHE